MATQTAESSQIELKAREQNTATEAGGNAAPKAGALEAPFEEGPPERLNGLSSVAGRGDALLRYRADYRTLVFVSAHFVLTAVAYAAGIGWHSLLLVPLLCYTSFTVAVITHNTIHSPVFRNPWLEQLLHGALTVGYGHPAGMFVPGHNLSHHAHLQTAKDAIRTTKLRYRVNLLNQLLFTHTIAGRVTADNFRYWLSQRQKNPTFFRRVAAQLLWFIAFSAFMLWLSPLCFVAYVLIPHQYAAWGILGVNFIQHDGCDETHPYNHSRNFVSPLLNWFLFNNGYHGAHHMCAALHWSRLPEAHEQWLHGKIHPALEQPSLLAYLLQAFIWPARRTRYDGTLLELPAPVADESWLPSGG